MNITYLELQQRIPSLATYDSEGKEIDRYAKFLKIAEKWFITNITGQVLFDVIDTSTTDSVGKNFCKDIICYKGYTDAIPFLDVIETGSGFSVTNNQNLAPASRERVNALKNGLLDMLTQSIENFIEFLEKEEMYHDEWKGTKTYSILTDTFIHTLTDFNYYAKFEGNRLDFIKSKPTMLHVINLKIAKLITAELCNEIIEQLRDDELSIDNRNIIENIKYAYANFVIGNNSDASSYLLEVQNFLILNVDKYPLFKNSNIYANYLKNLSNNTTTEGILVTF